MSTPARFPNATTSERASLPAGSGENLLKSGASTTGASQAKTAAIATTATLPGSHQRARKRRTSAISNAAPPAASAAPIAADLPASASQKPSDWVETP